MQRAHGMDTSFLSLETATTGLHTLSVSVHGPSRSREPLAFDALKRDLEARLEVCPLLWHRPIATPFALAPPLWIADSRFRLERHLRRVRLSGHASLEELFAVVSEIGCMPLRRDRPLWELTFVEGLAGGHTAEILKLHHAICDGAKTAWLFERVLFASPPERTRHPHRSERSPSRDVLLRGGLEHVAAAVFALPYFAGRTLGQLLRAWWHRRHQTVHAAVAFESRNVSFNLRLTAARSFVGVRLPFERVRLLAASAGCTINDVFLSICSGALRNYFQAHRENPKRSLIAAVPIALGEGAYGAMRGNRVSAVFADLATDEVEPRKRLRRVQARMNAAKDKHRAQHLGVEQLIDCIPPLVLTASVHLLRWLVRGRRVPAPVNLVVSNVNGPDARFRRCGRSVVAQWFVGPLIEGVGLNITAWSYADVLHVGLLSCPDLGIELSTLGEGIVAALGELEEAFAVRESCVVSSSAR